MKQLTRLNIYELALKQLYEDLNNEPLEILTTEELIENRRNILLNIIFLKNEIEKLKNRQNGQKNKGN